MTTYTSKAIKQSKNQSAKGIRLDARSFAVQLLLCCNYAHDEIIADYMRKAGAPTNCTRTQLEKTDFYKRAEGMLANYMDGTKRVRVSVTSNYEDALVFDTCTKFHNLDGVHEKTTKLAADADAIKTAFRYYVQKVVRVPVHEEIKYTQNGKICTREVIKLDAEGKKVYEEQTRKMWVCASSNRYTLAEVMRIFFEVIGVDAAIAEAKAEEAAEKAEKAAQAAAKAAEVAAKVATDTHAKAEKADAKAAEKKQKAVEKKAEAREARKVANAAK
jgi:hypothetical protein